VKLQNFLKKKILQTISKTGYELVGNKPIIKHNNFNAIIKFLINELCKIKNPIIFDVGANAGQSIERFINLFKNDDLNIYSFEPTPKLFEILKNKYNSKKNIKIFQSALNDKIIKSKFFSYEYDKVNSFTQIDKNSKFNKFLSLKNKDFLNLETQIEVQTNTIDNVVNEQNIDNIDVLKIDIQGNEDKVLEGSKILLKSNKIKLIELELILGFGYQRQMSFFDIEKVLNPFGYRLIAIDNASNVIRWSIYQVNLIYVNLELFDKIKHLHYENKGIKNIVNKTDYNNPFNY
jgi:FkbM family methyltransferase